MLHITVVGMGALCQGCGYRLPVSRQQVQAAPHQGSRCQALHIKAACAGHSESSWWAQAALNQGHRAGWSSKGTSSGTPGHSIRPMGPGLRVITTGLSSPALASELWVTDTPHSLLQERNLLVLQNGTLSKLKRGEAPGGAAHGGHQQLLHQECPNHPPRVPTPTGSCPSTLTPTHVLSHTLTHSHSHPHCGPASHCVHWLVFVLR